MSVTTRRDAGRPDRPDDTAATPGEPGGVDSPGRRRRRALAAVSRFAPVSIVMVLVPACVGLVKVLLTLHQPFVNSGDVAVIESTIRDTLGGHQLLGPYSHFGWFHPGPAYFYLMAPLYWIFGRNPRALFLGAFLINAGCAIAVVAVIRWRLGELAARWAALVVGGLLFFIQASTLWLYNSWNPAVLALPLLLVMVLAAVAATGSTLSLVWAALVGTFVVQSEVGTAPAVLASLVVGAILWAVARRRQRAASAEAGTRRAVRVEPSRHLAALAGFGLLVLAWVPPLIQQTTQTPGNVTKIVTFFEHPPAAQQAGGGHTRVQALRSVAEYATTLPLKENPFPCCVPNLYAGPRSLYADRYAVFGGGVLVGIGVALIGWRRRHQLALALGTISVVATAAALVSATRVVGPINGYLVWWTSAVLVPAWIGAGILALDWLGVEPAREAGPWAQPAQETGPRTQPAGETGRAGPLSGPTARRIVAGVLAVGCAVPCLALAWSLFRDPAIAYGDDPGRQAAGQLVEGPVRALHVRDLRVRETDPNQFALAVSVVLQLQKAGVAVHVEPPLDVAYGPQEQLHGTDQALLVISGPADPAPAASTAGATHLGTVEGMALWLRPLPSH